MANTQRRPEDYFDKMFFPRTLDGSGDEDKFITGTKLFILLADLLIAMCIILSVQMSMEHNNAYKLIVTLITIYVALWIIRMFVFEEKYYYKMYKKRKALERNTPGLFWDIIRKVDTEHGCVAIFSNLSAGVYVRLTRGCTIGKESDFKENHYDAISDMYKALNARGLSFKKADIMEPASKDDRVSELDYIVRASEFNENLHKLTSLKVGKLKSAARVSMVEEEYMLIYQNMYTDADDIITKVMDSLYVIMDGGYTGFTILDSEDIDDLACEDFGVRMFNSNSATLDIYRATETKLAFNIYSVIYRDGTQELMSDIEEKIRAEKRAQDKAKFQAMESNTNKKVTRPNIKKDGDKNKDKFGINIGKKKSEKTDVYASDDTYENNNSYSDISFDGEFQQLLEEDDFTEGN